MNNLSGEFLSNKRLILFDLDGVLLNSKENMNFAWSKACKVAHINVGFEAYFREIGRPFSSILGRLGIKDPDHLVESTFRVASMERLDLLSFYTNVRRVLAQLGSEGFMMGIVTSKDKLRTNAIVAMLPVEFDCVHSPNNSLRGKPAPDHLLMAMAQANVDPSETLYVGDMDADHEAALRAGVDYAHASWGYGGEPQKDCWILSDIADLIQTDKSAQSKTNEVG